MLGHSQEPTSKHSRNKETQDGQSLDDSKSENQSSILINTHFKRHKANTAFLSDRVQSTNQLTNKYVQGYQLISFCKTELTLQNTW